MKKRILYWLLLCCNSQFLFAQNVFTVYTVSNSSLPDNNIQSLAVDRYGKKWIGTDNGLAVYNDTNWTIYNTSNSGLPNNSVRAIAFDSSGNTWIGTYFGGLTKFDGSTWTTWTTSNSGLPNDFVKAIDVDSAGDVWAGTGYGFSKFDGTNWTVWNSSNSVFTSDNIPSLRINRKTDYKYIGTLNGGYAEMDPSNNITLYNNANSNLVDNTINSIALDTNGYQCLALPADGFMIHFTANVWAWYYNLNSGIPTNTVYDVCVDRSNVKYLATLAGLARFDGSNWVVWDTINSNIPDNLVRRVVKEANGMLWVGTPSGLAKLSQGVGMTGDPGNSFAVSVYPNPNDGNFTLQLDNIRKGAAFFIRDLAGREVYSSVVVNNNFYEVHAVLSPGMYFAEVEASGRRSLVKFIVK